MEVRDISSLILHLKICRWFSTSWNAFQNFQSILRQRNCLQFLPYISSGTKKNLHLFVTHCVNYSFAKCKITRNKQAWFNSDWNVYFILPRKLSYPNYDLSWWVGVYQHQENIFNCLLLVTGKARLGKKEKYCKSVSIGRY